MKSLNKNWLKDKVDDYTIEEFEKIKSEIIKCSNTYKNVFNGAPFYENWSLESALGEINSYIEDHALILTSKFREQIIGFLVAINKATCKIINDINPYLTNNEKINMSGYITEANFIESENKYILGVGPNNAHKKDEFITIESLNKLEKQYIEIIKKSVNKKGDKI